ncbi:MAG TPA: STAS domain-containing protein [Xanthobacteraceae bacterium]|nr:STAS domain-containing protein [Xanthobacteraceae bacterium]
MEVRSEAADGAAAYRIIGRIDTLTSDDLESAAGPAGTSRIVFDLNEVDFISSAGFESFW